MKAKKEKSIKYSKVAFFDSGSSNLSALNANGDAANFFPLIWGKQSQCISELEREWQQQLGFLASFVGMESEKTGKIIVLRPPFALMKPPTSTSQFTYEDPQSFWPTLLVGGSSGAAQLYHPTRMALDPSYSRRKECVLIVGFDDGRLVLSKLQGATGMSGITSYFGGGGTSAAGGGMIVKKVDSVLYQGMVATSLIPGDQAEIEAVTWRGGLIAWADSSGVRLFDIESMSRIAHIDRPSVWVNDAQSSTAATNNGTPAKVITRTTVEATMAWEMDCVACGVVPVDEKHVAVLGLVPSPPSPIDSSDFDEHTKSKSLINDCSVAGGDNSLQLQIINRDDGKLISSDRLLLCEVPFQTLGNNRIITGNATEFCLLSSFACPRMDSSPEWDALDDFERVEIEKELGDVGPGSKLPDLHLRWNLSNDICSTGIEIQSEAAIYDDDRSVASDVSICSDNYVFAHSEPIGDILPVSFDLSTRSPPPIMTVIYSYDACLGLTRDVDDAIPYTRSLGKPALALRQAHALRRDIRRHKFDELIDDFFIALLRFGSQGKDSPLSSSRLKIAAGSLPILLGDDPRMWQRWIFMFGRIPGGLFDICEKILVRDPEMEGFVFAMCLEKMLEDAILNSKGQGDVISDDEPQRGEDRIIAKKMVDLFLETMRSWGSTSALRRRVQWHRYCAQNQRWGSQWHSSSDAPLIDPLIQQAEKDFLYRRISQTAFGVLENAHFSTSPLQNSSFIRQHIDSSHDSLFDADHLMTQLTTRLQLSDIDKFESNVDYDKSLHVLIGNIRDEPAIILEAKAELELMRERFVQGYYLAIGSRFMNELLTLVEETAVWAVNSFVNESIDYSQRDNSQCSLLTHEGVSGVERNKYCFFLSLIELHQLSHALLKRNYFFTNDNNNASAESPVVALIALIGLSFLETMRSWGTTSALRRRVQWHRYCAQNQRWGSQWHSSSGAPLIDPLIQQAEKDLHKRISQTAFGVLENAHFSTSPLQNNSFIRQHIDWSHDSLFDADHLMTRLATRLQLSDTDKFDSNVDYDKSFHGQCGANPATWSSRILNR